MGNKGLFSIMDIGSTGLMAERTRMNVIANNIANSNTHKTADGKPFRRQVVVFTPKFDEELNNSSKGDMQLGGVEIKEIKVTKEPFPKMYMPDHPDADKDGNVLRSNVNGAVEMVDMMTASRAYEANLAILRSAQKMINKTMSAFQR